MAMAMPQRPVGLDMKLSQPNMGLNYIRLLNHTCESYWDYFVWDCFVWFLGTILSGTVLSGNILLFGTVLSGTVLSGTVLSVHPQTYLD